MNICKVNGLECCECQPVCESRRKDDDFEDEVLYAISVNGVKPSFWYEEYPPQREINLYSEGNCKSANVIEKIITYSNVGRIK